MNLENVRVMLEQCRKGTEVMSTKSKPGAEIAAYDSDFFYGNGGWQET